MDIITKDFGRDLCYHEFSKFLQILAMVKVGFGVKIVIASTSVQEDEIRRLVNEIYSVVLPHYFTDSEIKAFEQQSILALATKQYEEFSTLRDAFQVISSLQTIISILEQPTLDEKYSTIFHKNVKLLQSYHLFFPFELDQFVQTVYQKERLLSIYTKADNTMLV